MKHRDYKQFEAGRFYHVYNKFVGDLKPFNKHEYARLFLDRLEENLIPPSDPIINNALPRRIILPDGAFSLISYSLMPNHLHLLLRQNTDLPIGKLISKVCTGFCMIYNKEEKRRGGVFIDQFKAKEVDSDDYLRWLIAYIHLNPVTADLVSSPELWEYSSCKDYLGERRDSFLDWKLIDELFPKEERGLDFYKTAAPIIAKNKALREYLLDENI